jgi:molybdopterin synthase catalytic subunit
MFTAITSDIIDSAVLLREVGAPEDGAILLFLGIVRMENEGRAVSGMRYDAYVDMAESVLREIAIEAAAIAESDRIAVVHRIGELRIGEVSVGIAVSSPHRAQSYDASRHVIEQIKLRLPVWKHEHYIDGDSAWLAGAIPASGAANE